MSFKKQPAILAVLALVPFMSFAQTGTTGSLSVTVVDATGAVVPGANLELTDTSTNAVRHAMTLESGAYSYPGLPFGEYKLLVARKGFSSELFSSAKVA